MAGFVEAEVLEAVVLEAEALEAEAALALVVSVVASAALAGVVHQEPPHHPGTDREEMRLALPIGASLVHQLEVGLVHQRGRGQGVTHPLEAHLPVGQAPQGGVDVLHQEVQRRLVRTARPGGLLADAGDIVTGGFHGT